MGFYCSDCLQRSYGIPESAFFWRKDVPSRISPIGNSAREITTPLERGEGVRPFIVGIIEKRSLGNTSRTGNVYGKLKYENSRY